MLTHNFYLRVFYHRMTVLEIDLGQSYTYGTTTKVEAQIIKAVGLIDGFQSYDDLPTPIEIMNRPWNNILSIKKTGDTKDYVLILSFEAI